MKRFLLLATLIILIAACLSSCGLFGKKECDHRVVNDSAVDPTCTETGLTEGKHCSECGEVLVKQQTVAPLGHTDVIDEAVAATCTEDGLTAGVHCSVCKATIIAQTVVPAAHTYGEWIDATEPNCFFEGEQTRACSVCDEVDTQKLAKIEHSFVQNEETKLFACEHCDARIYAGHLYAAFDILTHWFEAYEICDSLGGYLATITSVNEQAILTDIMNTETWSKWIGGIFSNNYDGWKWITGEKFDFTNWQKNQPNYENGHEWFICTTGLDNYKNWGDPIGSWNDWRYTAQNLGFICEWELDIVEDEHYFTEWEVTTEPTCFSDGEQWKICTHCGLEETEVLPQLEHNFVFNEATGITGCEHCSAAMYDGRIYKIFTVSLSWFDAYSYCDDLGGHLVTITSAEEQTFIETYMNSESFSSYAWIGAYTDGAEWQWVTDETFEYTNWDDGEPNCDYGFEFFGHINFTYLGNWNDYNPFDSSVVSLICEWEAE